MKKMIQAAIGLMGLAASFLPQQALAEYCERDCPPYGSCSVEADNVYCDCLPGPICLGWDDPPQG